MPSPFQLAPSSPTVQLHLPDGRALTGPRGATVGAFLQIVKDDFGAPIVAAVVNNELHELTYPIETESRVQPVTMDTAAVFMLGSIMLYMYRFSVVGYSFISSLLSWTVAGLAVTLLLTFLSARLRGVVRAAAWISDRVTVFLFLLIPISLVSLVVVIYRNLF